jgi:LPXTG-motif cell wall-anchored protein
MRLSAFSGFAKNITTRRALATGAAAVVLGTAMPLLAGGTPAWACGDQPGKVVAPSPVPGSAAPHGQVGSAFIAGAPDTITAGGPAIEVGEEVGNFTGVAWNGITPELAFYNTSGSALRTQDFNVQVMVDGNWRTLPMLHGCDPVIHADTSSLAQHLDNGRASRFLFRVSLSANAPADQQNLAMYTGPDAQGQVPSHDLKVVRATTPAKTNELTAGFFMMQPPYTITAGGDPALITIEAGGNADYRDVRPMLYLLTDRPEDMNVNEIVVQQGTDHGWQTVPMRSGGPNTLHSVLSAEQGMPIKADHAGHFSYRITLKAGATMNKLEVGVGAEADGGFTVPGGASAAGQQHDFTVLHPSATPGTPAPKPTPSQSATPVTAPVAATGAPAATSTPTTEATTDATTPAAAKLAYTGGGDTSWTLTGIGLALLAAGAAAVFGTRRRARR